MKKLTQRQIEMIEFCEDGKFAHQIAERFEIRVESVYPHLRRLMKEDRMKCEGGYFNKKGDAVKIYFSVNPHEITQPEMHMVNEGVQKINMDFVKAAHNPFNLGARHG